MKPLNVMIKFIKKNILVRKLLKGLLGLNNENLKVGTYHEFNRVTWLEKKLQNIPNGSRILDAGAGEQQFKRFCNHLNYISQDFAAYEPNNLKVGLQMDKWEYGKLDIVSDIAAIPEPNNSFDAIMCIEVFEHIINPREAIIEFSRLLKKDGYLIITAPFCSLTHFAPYHFYTGFTQFFYNEELRNHGFSIIEMNSNGNYFDFMAGELHRLKSVSEKYVHNSKLDLKEEVALRITLEMLDKLSKQEKGSSELLTGGYHILAQKI